MTKDFGRVTRRDTLKFLGTAFCLSAVAPASAAEAKKPRWKTAIGLNGFPSNRFPIREVLDFASRTGFDGVELTSSGGYPGPGEKQRINALKRLYDGFGLQIFSIQTGGAGSFAPDEAARKSWLEGWRNQARFAKAAGAECIGLWPWGGVTTLRGQTIDQAIGHFAQSLREVAKIADDLGLVISFEIEPPFVFNKEEHIHRILERANHPSVKTMLDPSHFDLMSGSTGRVHEMLKRVGVENIGYIHLTDTDGTLRDGGTSKHLPCGDGHVDMDAVFATLLEGGYEGWVMIDAWQIPDPYDASVKGKQAIDRALAKV